MWRTEYIQDPTVTDEEKAVENITLSWNSPQTFDTVKVKWGGGYMKGYKLQTSDDGENMDRHVRSNQWYSIRI